MRVLASFLCMGLIAGSAQAQSAVVNGPTLGFTSENGGTAIRPIIGIPGASILGDRLQIETEIRGALISPNQNYAIAARVEDAQPLFIDLRGGAPVLVEVGSVMPAADVMALSPSGSVAAIYTHETRAVHVIAQLPHAPEVLYWFDASRIPGTAASLAVSDSGAVILLRSVEEDRTRLWVMDTWGALRPLPVDQPSAAAFFPNSSDAVIADNATQSVSVLMDVSGASIQVPLISAEEGWTAFTGVAVSEDGRRVFLADSGTGNVAVVDMETRRPVMMPCRCQTTGFYRLRGSSIFSLSEASREPMMVLDASSSEPRIVIVPPSAKDGEAQ